VICSLQNNTGLPIKRINFNPEFKRKSAQLVVDQNYVIYDGDKATFCDDELDENRCNE